MISIIIHYKHRLNTCTNHFCGFFLLMFIPVIDYFIEIWITCRVLNNFCIFRFVNQYAIALSAPYRMAYTTFNRALNVRFTPKTVRDYCYRLTVYYRTKDALAAEYIKYYFHEGEKAEVDHTGYYTCNLIIIS